MIVAALVTSLIFNVALLAWAFYLADRWQKTLNREAATLDRCEALLKRLEPFKAYEDQVSR